MLEDYAFSEISEVTKTVLILWLENENIHSHRKCLQDRVQGELS